ncbi:hypothetical protein RGL39_003350 [Vibrio parahaemolyticus]|nr:hypothetical protein [Vibrio parahaemolyticus]
MAIKTKRSPIAKHSSLSDLRPSFLIWNNPDERFCPLCRNVITVNRCCDDCDAAIKSAIKKLPKLGRDL